MSILALHEWEKQNEGLTVFPGFTLEITEPSIVAISTHTHIRDVLLDAFLGKPVLSGGILTVDGQSLTSPRACAGAIGVVRLEDGAYDRIRVQDQVQLYQRLYASRWSVDELLALTGLEAQKRQWVKHLSYSEKQRLKMVRVCAQHPAVSIFEEPEQNVDLETRRILARLFQRLKAEGTTVLLLMNTVESAVLLAEDIYRLDNSGLQAVSMQEEEEENEHKSPPKIEEDFPSLPFEKIPTRLHDKLILFHPTEIDFVESIQGQVHIHSQGETFPGVFTLTELEDRLQPFGFFRCHRSYIVNLQNVREIMTWTRNSYTLILNDVSQAEIPLSKPKMTELKAMLGIK